MGMFDTFRPVPALICYRCGTTADAFQSKVGPCVLRTWTQVPEKPSLTEIVLPEEDFLPDEFQIYTSCRDCDAWLVSDCVAINSRWIKASPTKNSDWTDFLNDD